MDEIIFKFNKIIKIKSVNNVFTLAYNINT